MNSKTQMVKIAIALTLSASAIAQVATNTTTAAVSPIAYRITDQDLNIASGTTLLELSDFKNRRAEIEATADQDDALALLLVGLATSGGLSGVKDEKKGTEFVKRAAILGLPRAMFSYGYYLENGIGVKPSPTEAASWYSKSAAAGNARARYALGVLKSVGKGVIQNDPEAAQLFRQSAEAGFDKAMVAWGYALSDGVGVEVDQPAAMKWYRAAANLGDAGGMFNVAVMYQAGRSVRQDYGQAFSWYKKAAEAGDASAMFSLAKAYAKGEGTEVNDGEAERWIVAAANAGHIEASKTAEKIAASKTRQAPAPSIVESTGIPTVYANNPEVRDGRQLLSSAIHTDYASSNISMDVMPVANCNIHGAQLTGYALIYVPDNTNLDNKKTYEILHKLIRNDAKNSMPQNCTYGAKSAPTDKHMYMQVIENKNKGVCQIILDHSMRFNFNCFREIDIGSVLVNLEVENTDWGNFNVRKSKATLAREAAQKASAQALAAEQKELAKQAQLQKIAGRKGDFSQQANANLNASNRGYGAVMIDSISSSCFPDYAPDADCKDFRIESALSRQPSRADIANGITSIVSIKVTALSKTSASQQWREICNKADVIRVNSGPWRISTNYMCSNH